MLTVEQWVARDRHTELGRDLGGAVVAVDQVEAWEEAEWGYDAGGDGVAYYAGAEQYGLDPCY